MGVFRSSLPVISFDQWTACRCPPGTPKARDRSQWQLTGNPLTKSQNPRRRRGDLLGALLELVMQASDRIGVKSARDDLGSRVWCGASKAEHDEALNPMPARCRS